ncbi:MAG: hypothetical protein U1D30_18390 [Planctomycetota bacterium]
MPSDAIDRRLHLHKSHMPNRESDHLLNIDYNALCGGTCLDDIARRRKDEVFLDAFGSLRHPGLLPAERKFIAGLPTRTLSGG